LGLPIPYIKLERPGASAVILYTEDDHSKPSYNGMQTALAIPQSDIRLFGKPFTRKFRRMGVALSWGDTDTSMESLREKAEAIAKCISIHT
jgi:phosphoribosylglycinamide formyltransferase 2